MRRTWLPQIKWLVLFLARAFAPTMNDHYPEFQLTATNFMSMAVKSSELVGETSGGGPCGFADPKCE